MNKLVVIIGSLYFLLITIAFAETKNCSQFKKLTKEYAKCTAILIKKKTIEVKDKTAKNYNKNKKKINKKNLKEKLLKFKNSKSHKEFSEK